MEETTAPEPVEAPIEAPVVEEAPAPVEEAVEAAGVDLFGDDVKEKHPWVDKFDARDKPFSISSEELENLPMAAKQAIHNLRKMALDKTRGAADQRKEFESKQKAWEQAMQEKEGKLDAERLKLYEMFQDPRLQKLRQGPEGDEPDPWSEKGVEYRIQKGVADQLNSFFETIEDITKERKAAYDANIQEREAAQRKKSLNKFVEENPDFKDYKSDIIALKKAHPTLHYKEAYEIVKLRNAPKPEPVDPIREARSRSRALNGRPTKQAGAKAPSVDTKGMSARDIYKLMQERPDLQATLLNRIQRG